MSFEVFAFSKILTVGILLGLVAFSLNLSIHNWRTWIFIFASCALVALK
jgi:hypothetical protein